MSDLTNIIEVTFGSSNSVYLTLDNSFSYNSGLYLQFTDIDLPESYQVHFSNSLSDTALEVVGTSDGVLIPWDVWNNDKQIYAWIYLHPTDDSAVTQYEIRLAKRKRSPLPDGTEPSESEQTTIVPGGGTCHCPAGP